MFLSKLIDYIPVPLNKARKSFIKYRLVGRTRVPVHLDTGVDPGANFGGCKYAGNHSICSLNSKAGQMSGIGSRTASNRAGAILPSGPKAFGCLISYAPVEGDPSKHRTFGGGVLLGHARPNLLMRGECRAFRYPPRSVSITATLIASSPTHIVGTAQPAVRRTCSAPAASPACSRFRINMASTMIMASAT